MAKIYSPNQNHSCDYGIDFYYGVAMIPDAQSALLARFTANGYTVDTGTDALSPWDYVPVEELALYAPLIGLNPTGMNKRSLVAAIIARLALMKINITAFNAIANVGAGTEGEAVYANAASVIAALPTSVLANSGTVSIPVSTWVDTDTYNPNTAGTYTFTATLGALPLPYSNTGNLTATIDVVVGADAEITAFNAIANIDGGEVGTPTFANAAAVIAALPTSALANNGSVNVPITTWVDTDTYNAGAAASYTFTGTLGALPAGYKNTANVKPVVDVVVAPGE